MDRRRFLEDRLPHMVVSLLVLLLAVLVIELQLWQTNWRIEPANLLYICLLAVALIGFWLIFDYARQRAFRQQMLHLLSGEHLDSMAVVSAAVTHEQQLVQAVLARQYALFSAELTELRQRQERQVHFANRWVHQMKTPVAVISLLLEQSRGECPDHVLDSVAEEVEKLHRGLDLMLNSSRLDDFTSDFVVHQVNMADVLRNLINENKRLFISSRVFPKLELGQGEVLVETDEKWIGFVFSQIISNAVKYSPVGPDEPSKQLLILARSEEQFVTVSFQDQGIGIPPEDLGRVFDPFFTGENGRLYPQATGIGMYLAKEVCDRLGHHMQVASTPARGTTVSVQFSTNAGLHAAVPDSRDSMNVTGL